ncbi:MAG: NAD(P)-dependent oxidoreductase [Bacteroidetes bacterium]|nr:NAD(P)-dependent oxidoreductase [Bacteroidota bacterium]
MKKKLLITGASGFLGYHLLKAASKDREVYGIYHSRSLNSRSAITIHCDITDYISLGNYFDDIEPDAVIHAAAKADANFCQQNKEQSYLVNVEATKNIAGICSDYHIPLAFTSTDLVFDGTKGMYREDDVKNPVSAYGEQKSIAEDEVLRIYPDTTVFRLPLMFGYPEASATNYMQQFIGQMRNGETLHLFHDEYRSVCGAGSISEGILTLFEKTSGIIHLAGKERLSRLDFGNMVVKAFEIATEKIHACSQKDVKMSVARPADVSLDISKAILLGYNPLKVEEELGLIAQSSMLGS